MDKSSGTYLLTRSSDPDNGHPEHFGLMIVALVAYRGLINEAAIKRINQKYPANKRSGRERCVGIINKTVADPEFRKVSGDVSLGFLDALCRSLNE